MSTMASRELLAMDALRTSAERRADTAFVNGVQSERARLARAMGVGAEVLLVIGTEAKDGTPTPEATQAMETLFQAVAQKAMAEDGVARG